MMRDPARIKRISDKLAAVWERFPDMRYAQLLQWVVGRIDCFYVEDEDLEILLDDLLGMEARTR